MALPAARPTWAHWKSASPSRSTAPDGSKDSRFIGDLGNFTNTLLVYAVIFSGIGSAQGSSVRRENDHVKNRDGERGADSGIFRNNSAYFVGNFRPPRQS